MASRARATARAAASRSHEEATVASFRKHPARAAEYLNATRLYRTLSPRGNPELRSMTALLKAMGMRPAVVPVIHDRSRAGTAE